MSHTLKRSDYSGQFGGVNVNNLMVSTQIIFLFLFPTLDKLQENKLTKLNDEKLWLWSMKPGANRMSVFAGSEFASNAKLKLSEFSHGVFLQEHQEVCPYEHVPCSACQGSIQRRLLLGTHLTDECPKRIVECVYCQDEFFFIEKQVCIT